MRLGVGGGGDWGGQRPLLPVQLRQEALVVVGELGALESVLWIQTLSLHELKLGTSRSWPVFSSNIG